MLTTRNGGYPHSSDAMTDADNSHYSVSAFIKATKKELTQANPLVGISVGKRYHSGEYLTSILDMMEESLKNGYFKDQKIGFLVGGTLQRHNFSVFTESLSDEDLVDFFFGHEFNIDDLQELALQFSELFMHHAELMEEAFILSIKTLLAVRTTTYSHLSQQMTMLKWSSCVSKSSDSKEPETAIYNAYQDKFDKVIDFYNINDEFRDSIELRIDEFLRDEKQCQQFSQQKNRLIRLIPGFKTVDFDQLFRISSRNYLLEEIPLFLVLADFGYTHHLYPSKEMPKSFGLAFNELNKKRLKWTHICFNDKNVDVQLQRINQKIQERELEIQRLEQEAQTLKLTHQKKNKQSMLRKQFENGEEEDISFVADNKEHTDEKSIIAAKAHKRFSPTPYSSSGHGFFHNPITTLPYALSMPPRSPSAPLQNSQGEMVNVVLTLTKEQYRVLQSSFLADKNNIVSRSARTTPPLLTEGKKDFQDDKKQFGPRAGSS